MTKKGEHHSPESRAKIAAAAQGRKLSEATKQKISAALAGRPAHEMTPARLAGLRVISQKLAGRKLPPRNEAYRQHLSEANMGHGVTVSDRQKMSATTRLHLELGLGNYLKAYAKRMREHPTRIEVALRARLESEGVSDLQTQVIFGRRIVDFYSPSRQTVYEADSNYWHGVRHPRSKDVQRDTYLQEWFLLAVYHYTETELLGRKD